MDSGKVQSEYVESNYYTNVHATCVFIISSKKKKKKGKLLDKNKEALFDIYASVRKQRVKFIPQIYVGDETR